MSRVTYLIDKTGVIRDVYHHEVRIGKHVEDVLEGVKALDREGRGKPQRIGPLERGKGLIHATATRHRSTFSASPHLRPTQD